MVPLHLEQLFLSHLFSFKNVFSYLFLDCILFVLVLDYYLKRVVCFLNVTGVSQGHSVYFFTFYYVNNLLYVIVNVCVDYICSWSSSVDVTVIVNLVFLKISIFCNFFEYLGKCFSIASHH